MKKINAAELRELVQEAMGGKTYNIKKKKKDAKRKQEPKLKEGFFDSGGNETSQKAEKLGKAMMGNILQNEAGLKKFLGDISHDEVENLADGAGEYVKKRLAQTLGMMASKGHQGN